MGVVKKPVADFTEILSGTCILSGENVEHYNMVHAEVENVMQPKNIIEKMAAKDVADKIWEGQRYKNLEGQLIESARPEALAALLLPIKGYIQLAHRTK